MTQQIEPGQEYPIITWDTVWDPEVGEGAWVAKDICLQADNAIGTAMVLQLFTDRRAPDDATLPDPDDTDRRGWFGDYVDISTEDSEREMGSLIWLYERSILNDLVAEQIRQEAEDCLQVLVEQGLCAQVEVIEEHDVQGGWVGLTCNCYSETGALKYSQKFQRYWRQIAEN